MHDSQKEGIRKTNMYGTLQQVQGKSMHIILSHCMITDPCHYAYQRKNAMQVCTKPKIALQQ